MLRAHIEENAIWQVKTDAPLRFRQREFVEKPSILPSR